MKRFVFCVIAVLTVMVFAGAALADQKNTGCGLGSIVFQGQDGLLSQICAVTTNGICGNQTFGISSGTLNCARPASLAANKKLNIFVADNMDNLAKDIAKGNGEYLNTLAVLMEIPQVERTSFYSMLQTNFSHIYTSGTVGHIDVLNNIETVMSSS